MSSSFDSSASSEVREDWISRMASAFKIYAEICAFLYCLMIPTTDWTDSMANPAGMGYSLAPTLSD